MVDVKETLSEKMSIYPNPTTGMIYFDAEKSFDVVIYNYQGQVVLRKNDNNGYIDLSEMSAGIYFLELRNNDKLVIEKIILTK